MRPANVLRLYRVRLASRIVQECLAIVGIAAGVALLFASQVSSQSLAGSVGQLSRGVVGSARLQLLARDPHGFPESMLERVRAVRGVRVAAPLLEASANADRSRPAASPSSSSAPTAASRAWTGASCAISSSNRSGVSAGVVLSAPLARTVGVVKFGREVTIQVEAERRGAALRNALDAQDRGARAEPDRARAAVLRAGNDRSRGTREPDPRDAGPWRAGARARGARDARRRKVERRERRL